MAIIVTAADQYLSTRTNLPDEQMCSVCGFSKLLVDTNQVTLLFVLHNELGDFKRVITGADGTSLGADDNTVATATQALTVGRWFFWAAVFGPGGSIKFYYRALDSAAWFTATAAGEPTDWAAGQPTIMAVYDAGFNEYFSGAHAHLKIWNAALTEVEMKLESYRETPVRTSNLNRYAPLNHAGDTFDRGTFRRHMTRTGVFTTGPSLLMPRPARRVLYIDDALVVIPPRSRVVLQAVNRASVF